MMNLQTFESVTDQAAPLITGNLNDLNRKFLKRIADSFIPGFGLQLLSVEFSSTRSYHQAALTRKITFKRLLED